MQPHESGSDIPSVPNITSLLRQRELGSLRGRNPGIGQTSAEARRALGAWTEGDFLQHCSSQYVEFKPVPRSTIAASFSPNGSFLASTHGDHTVKIVNCFSGAFHKALEGHTRTPWVVRFHPIDSDVIASGSLDHRVVIWRISTAEKLYTHDFGKPIASIAFHPSGKALVVASGHKVYFWDYMKSASSSRPNPNPSYILRTKRSLRALHFHPLGLPLILTAEVVDSKKSSSSSAAATGTATPAPQQTDGGAAGAAGAAAAGTAAGALAPGLQGPDGGAGPSGMQLAMGPGGGGNAAGTAGAGHLGFLGSALSDVAMRVLDMAGMRLPGTLQAVARALLQHTRATGGGAEASRPGGSGGAEAGISGSHAPHGTATPAAAQDLLQQHHAQQFAAAMHQQHQSLWMMHELRGAALARGDAWQAGWVQGGRATTGMVPSAGGAAGGSSGDLANIALLEAFTAASQAHMRHGAAAAAQHHRHQQLFGAAASAAAASERAAASAATAAAAAAGTDAAAAAAASVVPGQMAAVAAAAAAAVSAMERLQLASASPEAAASTSAAGPSLLAGPSASTFVPISGAPTVDLAMCDPWGMQRIRSVGGAETHAFPLEPQPLGSTYDLSWGWEAAGSEGAAAAAAAAHVAQRHNQVLESQLMPLAMTSEQPCVVNLNVWAFNHRRPSSTLDKARISVPRAVLCSEMGAQFSPCGRYLALCVAVDEPSEAGRAWLAEHVRQSKQRIRVAEAVRDSAVGRFPGSSSGVGGGSCAASSSSSSGGGSSSGVIAGVPGPWRNVPVGEASGSGSAAAGTSGAGATRAYVPSEYRETAGGGLMVPMAEAWEVFPHEVPWLEFPRSTPGAAARDALAKAREAARLSKPLYELRVYSLDGRSFGSVLAARLVRAAHCLTSVQFSPTSEHLLVAYGRRYISLCNLIAEGRSLVPAHTIIEVYSTKNLQLVRVLPSLEDEVNVATFHPVPGAGLVYGTKEGRLRVLRYDRRAPRRPSIPLAAGGWRMDDELAAAERDDSNSDDETEAAPVQLNG